VIKTLNSQRREGIMKGWKTLLIAVATAVFGVLETFDITSVLDNPTYAGIAVAVIGVVNGVLRKFTDTPILSDKPKKIK